MKYYPKNRIKTGLYTSGKEFINPTNNKSYVGYYYKTYEGSSYIGKDPSVTPIIKLIPLKKETTSPEQPHIFYLVDEAVENSVLDKHYELRKIDPSIPKLIPVPHYPQLTEEDYKYNTYSRYFVKRRNREEYMEIDSQTYNKIFNKDKNWVDWYIPFSIEWVIKGNKEKAYKQNQKIVNLISRSLRLIKFKSYLKEDYTKFWRS